MRGTIIIFLAFSTRVFCQERDDLSLNNAGTDSASLPLVQKIHSLTKRDNDLRDIVGRQMKPSDNLKIGKLTIIPSTKREYSAKANSTEIKLLDGIDSLKAVPSSDTVLIKKLSRLHGQVDSLMFHLPLSDSLTRKSSKAKSKIDAKINTAEKMIKEKLRPISENNPKDLPEALKIEARSLALPESINPQLSIPSIPNLKDAPNIPDVIPDASIVNKQIPQIDIENLLDGQTIPAIPDVQLPSVPSANVKGITDLNLGKEMKGVSEVSEKIESLSEQISEVPQQIDEYSKELEKLKSGDLEKLEQLPDQIEKAAMQSEHLAGLEEKLVEVDALKSKAERFADPMVAKEEALNRAKELAVNHFAGHEDELKAAMEKLSKLKQKFPDAEGTLDLFQKTQDPHRGKRFVERLTPGFSFQVQAPTSIWLDVAPALFCTINARWSTGIAWNERLAYNWDNKNWQPQERIYGPRVSIHFRLKPNLILKGDIETMNTPLNDGPLYAINDVTRRGRVWSYFGGMKREFQLSKRVKGNVQIMYNLYDKNHLSPYATRLNVRMGFDLPLKKIRTESPVSHTKKVD